MTHDADLVAFRREHGIPDYVPWPDDIVGLPPGHADAEWHQVRDVARPPLLVGEVYTECLAGAAKLRHDAYERLVWFQSEAMWEALAECAQ